MSLLNAESPDLVELLELLDVQVLWHPSLSNGSPDEHRDLLDRILSGEQTLDILCLEGAVVRERGMLDLLVQRMREVNLTGEYAKTNVRVVEEAETTRAFCREPEVAVPDDRPLRAEVVFTPLGAAHRTPL